MPLDWNRMNTSVDADPKLQVTHSLYVCVQLVTSRLESGHRVFSVDDPLFVQVSV
jgi:hypothetical protein